MNNNILPESPRVIYEPHVYSTRELPFIFHEDRYFRPGPCNVHRNPELLRVVGGSGIIRNGDEVLEVGAGDLVVVEPYAVHQVLSDGGLHFYCLIPDLDFCIANGLNADGLSFPPRIRDEELLRRFDRIVAEYRNPSSFPEAGIRCAVLDIMLDLCRRYAVPRTAGREMEPSFGYIRKAMEYIKQNIGKKLTVDAIAASAGLSKYYFLRRFKETTGRTVMDYVNTLRCEYARELLQTGRYSVKQTAGLCGFENLSYFTNVFKKYTGLLPSSLKGAPESDSP